MILLIGMWKPNSIDNDEIFETFRKHIPILIDHIRVSLDININVLS